MVCNQHTHLYSIISKKGNTSNRMCSLFYVCIYLHEHMLFCQRTYVHVAMNICSCALACFAPFLVETGYVVGGLVTFGVNDGSVDGGSFDVAMTEQLGDGVEVCSCHERHCRIAVTCRVEGDVFRDVSVVYPLCNRLLDGGGDRQIEDGLVWASFPNREPA